jgi:hemoglobin/transferrin/lactoferrin receptor protein
LFGSVAWQEGSEDTYYGQDVAFPGDNRPISRMLPLSGEIGVRWQPQRARYWAELTIDAAAGQDKLADSDKADNRFPPGGTPGWTVYNLRSGWEVTEALTLTLALENITDKEYRIHGSGINEPGRNVVFAVRARF